MVDRWWMLGALFLVGLTGCGGTGDESATHEEEKKAEAHVSVKAEAARRSTVSEAVEGLGRIEALPDQLATLTPAVEGHVHELLVKQGDSVKKGQPIVDLDQAVAKADLAEKTGTRDGLKASLALLKSLPRPAEQKPLVLAIEQAKVALDRAKRVADELKTLQANKLVSPQQLFDAEKAVEAARLQVDAAESQHHAQMIGPRPEAVAEAEGRIKTADGLVEFSRAHLDFHTIRSPIDGVLDSLTCHPGQTISVGTPIGEVVDTRQVYAVVWLSPRLARGVGVGQAGVVRLSDEHSASAEAERLAGKVDFVGRVVDPQTGNLPIHVLVDNSKGQLALGQTVQVVIDRGEKADVLQVPVAAVLDMGEGPVLAVVRDEKSVELHPTVGTARDGWVAVSGTDLKEGEPVIVEGGYNLPEGTHVDIAKDEPAKGEPAKGEPAKDEPAKGEPAKGEPAKDEPAKGEPAKGEPTKDVAKAEVK
jgi:multidrug efflux pump subunit AcrA (membrane-fusion protein)